MIDPVRQEILQIFAELSEAAPDVRLGQLLANLSCKARGHSSELIWNMEDKAQASGVVEQVVDMAGTCLNTALEAAANEPLPANRVFSPQNWIKTKSCLAGIRAAIQRYFTMLPSMPAWREVSQKLRSSLAMDASHFDSRGAAD